MLGKIAVPTAVDTSRPAAPLPRRSAGPAGGISLIAFGCCLAVLTGELTLRLMGFQYEAFPTVQVGWPDPHTLEQMYVPERELRWVPWYYGQQLAAARDAKPALVFMGDSATQFGSYPELAMERLQDEHPSLASG